jgi:hypothetical protein
VVTVVGVVCMRKVSARTERTPPPRRRGERGIELGVGGVVQHLHVPQRIAIDSRWVSQPLAFAGELRPPRLNHQPHLHSQALVRGGADRSAIE